jgi:hypothetical protein
MSKRGKDAGSREPTVLSQFREEKENRMRLEICPETGLIARRGFIDTAQQYADYLEGMLRDASTA